MRMSEDVEVGRVEAGRMTLLREGQCTPARPQSVPIYEVTVEVNLKTTL